MIATFNAYHLGDNLVHLNFMRRLALKYPTREFGHYCASQHQAQVAPLFEGVPNLRQLHECPGDAINAWRGAGNYWYMHEERNNFTWFHIDWFGHLAGVMGLESPINTASDMLFDYPGLDGGDDAKVFDYLLVNSIPHSGQARQYNSHAFEELAKDLLSHGKSVISTFPTGQCECTHDGTSGLSVTAIGKLSRSCGAIIGIPTGPMWPTFNVHNKGKRRVLMLDNEFVMIEPNTFHVQNVDGMRKELLP